MRLPTKRSYTYAISSWITLLSITRFENRLLRKSRPRFQENISHTSHLGSDAQLHHSSPANSRTKTNHPFNIASYLSPRLSLWICPLQMEGQTLKMQWSISCWMLQLWLACEGVSTDPGALVFSFSSGIKIRYPISSPPVDNVTGWVGYIWSFCLRAWCFQ